MANSIEYRTLLNRRQDLIMGLTANMTWLAGKFLAEGLIDNECNDDVNNSKSVFNLTQKSEMMVGRIMTKVSVSKKNYHRMMAILSQDQTSYRDTLNNIDQEYKSLGGKVFYYKEEGSHLVTGTTHTESSTNVAKTSETDVESERKFEAFDESMNTGELCSWLQLQQIPKKDIDIIRENDIGGKAFKLFSKKDLETFGISKTGLLLIENLKKTIPAVSPSPPPPAATAAEQSKSPVPAPVETAKQAKHTTRTVLKQNHWGKLCEQLNSCAPQWSAIAANLGFSQGEIEIIQGNFTIATQGPPGFLRKMLGDYLHWAPGDARGSKDFATLESLKDAVSGAGFGTEALDLDVAGDSTFGGFAGQKRQRADEQDEGGQKRLQGASNNTNGTKTIL